MIHAIQKKCGITAQRKATGEKGPATELEPGTFTLQPRAIGPSHESFISHCLMSLLYLGCERVEGTPEAGYRSKVDEPQEMLTRDTIKERAHNKLVTGLRYGAV